MARLQVHKYVNICHCFISNVLCTSLSSKLPEYSVRCEKQARASPTVHFSFISDSHDPLSLDYQRCIRDVQAVIFCAECLLQHKHHFPQYHACTIYIVTILPSGGMYWKKFITTYIDSYELCAKFW